jgi:nicotinate-nucleotide--dimethylbenzimidazole phosphoribosyltransferase
MATFEEAGVSTRDAEDGEGTETGSAADTAG